jgi:hypothetical protein
MKQIMLASILATCTIGISADQRAAAGPDTTARAVAAAEAFLATLDPPKRAKANLDLNDKTRIVWSNLPTGIAMQVGAKERNGLKLGDMTPAQEKAALALLAATLSPDGYRRRWPSSTPTRCSKSGARRRARPARRSASAARSTTSAFWVSRR